MAMLWYMLGTPQVQTAVMGIFGAAFGLVKKWQSRRKWKLDRALECVEAGVQETYAEYVRAAKERSDDGKLSDGERREAVRRASNYARQYAARQGVNLLKVYAVDYLPVLIEKIVKRAKITPAN